MCAAAEAALAEIITARDAGLETEKTLRAETAEARNPPILSLVFSAIVRLRSRRGLGHHFVRFGAHAASCLASVPIVRARVRARLRARARRRGLRTTTPQPRSPPHGLEHLMTPWLRL